MIAFLAKYVNDPKINGGDGVAGGVWLIALFQWIPHITAALSLVWICLRLWVTIRDDFINKRKKDEHE